MGEKKSFGLTSVVAVDPGPRVQEHSCHEQSHYLSTRRSVTDTVQLPHVNTSS